MTPILQYLLKLSISLSVVFLFYQLVLRRLTFYNWNRWYLISYSLLSFFIPFIDVSLVLNKNEWNNTSIVQWLPTFQTYTTHVTASSGAAQSLTFAGIVQLVLIAGMTLMLIRLFVQLFSFRNMMRKASMIPSDGMKIYQVHEKIIPFSFGNSIFINRSLHSEQELGEIILHEFVHVKQRHSVDIIFSEILCLINWYNPAAWLIRRAIRQNLEFIADNQVLQNGIDRKQYQYLLLKVIGNDHFSIASKFNFSSLKKRIAMMNKMKSAGVHLIKFLFILPLVAVLLVAFRNKYNEQLLQTKSDFLKNQLKEHPQAEAYLKPAKLTRLTDTIPASAKSANDKGYVLDIKKVDGNCTVIVKDQQGKEVDKILLDEWNEKSEKYETMYGELLPPAPPLPPIAPLSPLAPIEPDAPIPPVAPLPPLAPIPCCSECPSTYSVVPATAIGRGIGNGESNGYSVSRGYGISKGTGLSSVASEYEITNNAATMKLRDGSVEKYDLSKPEEKAVFEKKYGQLISVDPVSAATSVASVRTANGRSIIAPMAVGSSGVMTIVDDYGHTITGKEDVLVTITRNTTRQELDQFITKMKEKGIDLIFDEIEYNEKGKLVTISGQMKSKDGESNFVASDFDKLILAMIKTGDQTYFKVNTTDKEVI